MQPTNFYIVNCAPVVQLCVLKRQLHLCDHEVVLLALTALLLLQVLLQ
jgi:hypothetical protein